MHAAVAWPKNISFKLAASRHAAGAHVGICGRTGAGKSSLLAALLRLTPISTGRITVDGVDVSALPLRVLRRAIGAAGLRCRVPCQPAFGATRVPAAIPTRANPGCLERCHSPTPLPAAGVVPQHPFLFEGSVRQNLDPLGQHSAAELAAVLRQVQLWQPLVAQLPAVAQPGTGGSERGSGHAAAGQAAGTAAAEAAAGEGAAPNLESGARQAAAQDAREEQARVLAMRLGEGAAALSQGQQQLLALGRVLLGRLRLLLLDEATSSVDPATADVMHEVRHTK